MQKCCGDIFHNVIQGNNFCLLQKNCNCGNVNSHSLLIGCLDLRFAESIGSGILEGGVVGVSGGGGFRRIQSQAAKVLLPQQEFGSHHQVPADRREISWCSHWLKEYTSPDTPQ